MPVNLDQRQFFAKPIALTFVRAEVDPLLVGERVYEAIEFLLALPVMLSVRHLVQKPLNFDFVPGTSGMGSEVLRATHHRPVCVMMVEADARSA